MTVRPVLTPVRTRSKVQHQPLPTYRYCRFGSRKKTAKMVENGDHTRVHATIRIVNCRPNRVACSTAVVYTVSPTNFPVHSATVRLVLEVFSRVIFDVTRSRMTTNLDDRHSPRQATCDRHSPRQATCDRAIDCTEIESKGDSTKLTHRTKMTAPQTG